MYFWGQVGSRWGQVGRWFIPIQTPFVFLEFVKLGNDPLCCAQCQYFWHIGLPALFKFVHHIQKLFVHALICVMAFINLVQVWNPHGAWPEDFFPFFSTCTFSSRLFPFCSLQHRRFISCCDGCKGPFFWPVQEKPPVLYPQYTAHAVVLTKILSQPLRQNVLFSP